MMSYISREIKLLRLFVLTSQLILIVLVSSCSGTGNSTDASGSKENDTEASPILIEFSDSGQDVNQTIMYVDGDKYLYASGVYEQFPLSLKDSTVILNEELRIPTLFALMDRKGYANWFEIIHGNLIVRNLGLVDNGYLISGWFRDYLQFENNSRYNLDLAESGQDKNIYLALFNESGEIEWLEYWPRPEIAEWSTFYQDMLVSNSGNIIITSTLGNIRSYTPSGELLWSKSTEFSITSLGEDEFGNLYITTNRPATLAVIPSPDLNLQEDVTIQNLVKLNRDGDIIWENPLNDFQAYPDPRLVVDNYNNIFVFHMVNDTLNENSEQSANMETLDEYFNMNLSKFNPDGELLDQSHWFIGFGRPFVYFRHDIKIDEENNIVLAGHTIGGMQHDAGDNYYSIPENSWFCFIMDDNFNILNEFHFFSENDTYDYLEDSFDILDGRIIVATYYNSELGQFLEGHSLYPLNTSGNTKIIFEIELE